MAYRQLSEERSGPSSPGDASGPPPLAQPQASQPPPRPTSPLRHEIRFPSEGSSLNTSLIDIGGEKEADAPTYYSTAPPGHTSDAASRPASIANPALQQPKGRESHLPPRTQSPSLTGKIGQSTTPKQTPSQTLRPPLLPTNAQTATGGSIDVQLDTLDEPVWHTIV